MSCFFSLQNRLLPIESSNGFQLPDHWVWDGSIIQDEDGRWHMFASRWPKSLAMHPGWLFGSEVVRAASDSATGPYHFEEVVFEPRDVGFFDSRMTHNPSIRKAGDTYLLFYIGCTWFQEMDFTSPFFTQENPEWFHDPWTREVYSHMRIGLATSKSLYGPWERRDEPILEVSPAGWDKGTLVNPSPFVMESGEIYMAYASSHPVGQTDAANSNIGIAYASDFTKPFKPLSQNPCFSMPDQEAYWFEDPFLWHDQAGFHLIMKDMMKSKTQEQDAGVFAWSPDAVHWTWGDPPEAYSRKVQIEGLEEELGQVERPQLIFEGEGKRPSYFTAACAKSEGLLSGVSDTWVRVFPLKK